MYVIETSLIRGGSAFSNMAKTDQKDWQPPGATYAASTDTLLVKITNTITNNNR